jgi:surface carbohydrate biosynthesis protein (TIGR04326 family)
MMMPFERLVLIVWDSNEPPPVNSDLVYRWQGYAENANVHSLLHYVETHGERLRQKYLAWIHDLGEVQIGGKRLIDQLVLKSGLSYWWLTLLVEKSPWKSPSLRDVICIFALEEVLQQQKPEQLRLFSANGNLHRVLKDLCQNLGVAFEGKRPAGRFFLNLHPKNLLQKTPRPLRALVGFTRLVWRRWALRQVLKPTWFGGDKALFFCSYFFNVVARQAQEGRFHSRFWEGLTELAGKLGFTQNWLQLYYPHSNVPNTQVAQQWTQAFNQDPIKQGYHRFLDSYLSWRIVGRVLKGWFKLMLASWRLGKIRQGFHMPDSSVSLWSLVREDWIDSLRGSVAIENLLWIELFDAAFGGMPWQKKGFFLCENQAWERALIHAWRKHGHGQLIAVAHATLRFWDLRYFTDLRTLQSTRSHSLPQADVLVLNGKAAIDAFLRVDYPRKNIVEGEALRYGYLQDLQATQILKIDPKGKIKLLILGDYKSSLTLNMLQMLAAAQIFSEVECTVKPHPNFPVRAVDFPALPFQVVTAPLGEILQNYDMAYSSNMTSAAVDAYLAGLPVVVMLDETQLNFSPLRGQSGVRFVSSPAELAQALKSASQENLNAGKHKDFFFLDPKLPRWQNLLLSQMRHHL